MKQINSKDVYENFEQFLEDVLLSGESRKIMRDKRNTNLASGKTWCGMIKTQNLSTILSAHKTEYSANLEQIANIITDF